MGTNAGKTYEVSTTAENADLDQAAFALLTYTEIGNVGTFPEYGEMANIAEYKTAKGTLKGKGAPQYGGGDLECAREFADAGQVLLRTYAQTDNNYAFKVTHADGSIDYLRGIVAGPMRPQGGDEDFEVEKYSLGFNQKPVEVAAP